jgi:hypothetical protein
MNPSSSWPVVKRAEGEEVRTVGDFLKISMCDYSGGKKNLPHLNLSNVPWQIELKD